MLRPFLAALLAGAALFSAAAAQAGTHWSIGINVPAAGVVVSSGPRYYVQQPAPVYYAPPPVVHYVPAYRQVHRDVYYVAPQVVHERRSDRRHWERRHERHARHHHHNHHRWDGERDHGPRRGH